MWLTLAAVETERLAPQGSEAREKEKEMPETGQQSQSLLFELGLLGLRSTTPRLSQYSESTPGKLDLLGPEQVAGSVPPHLQSLDLMKEICLGLQRTAPRQKVVLDHLGPEMVARKAQPLLQQM